MNKIAKVMVILVWIGAGMVIGIELEKRFGEKQNNEQYLRGQINELNEYICQQTEKHNKRVNGILKEIEKNGGGEFITSWRNFPEDRGQIIMSGDSRIDSSSFLLYKLPKRSRQ